MRKPEQLLWDRIKRANDESGNMILIERIENGAAAGHPDLECVCFGRRWAIEMKQITTLPLRDSTPLLGAKGLSQQQKNWHFDFNAYGAESHIAVGLPNRLIALVNGCIADEINQMSLAVLLEVCSFHGKPAELITYIINESKKRENKRHVTAA